MQRARELDRAADGKPEKSEVAPDVQWKIHWCVVNADWPLFWNVWHARGESRNFDVARARQTWRLCTPLQLAVVRRAPAEVVATLLAKPDVARASVNYGGRLPLDCVYGRTPLELARADYDWFNGLPFLSTSRADPARKEAVIRVLIAHGGGHTSRA